MYLMAFSTTSGFVAMGLTSVKLENPSRNLTLELQQDTKTGFEIRWALAHVRREDRIDVADHSPTLELFA